MSDMTNPVDTHASIQRAAGLRPATIAVKAGRPERHPDAPLNPPIVMASTYVAGGSAAPSLLRSAETASASARSADRMSVLPSPDRLVVHPGGSESEKPAVSLIRRVHPGRGATGGSAVSFGEESPEEDEPPQPAAPAASARQTRRGRHRTNAPSWIRTSGLLLRRESLYPV